MKAMISQPMRGKSEAEIRAEREFVVRKLVEKGYEVVDSVFSDFVVDGSFDADRAALKYLAKSIELMAEVDMVYFMKGWDEARGCMVEYVCCCRYGIKHELER